MHPSVLIANRRIRQLPYKADAARAGVAIAEELLNAGGNEAKLGGAIIRGVCKGLGEELESKHRFPVCPRCGRRHPQ